MKEEVVIMLVWFRPRYLFAVNIKPSKRHRSIVAVNPLPKANPGHCQAQRLVYLTDIKRQETWQHFFPQDSISCSAQACVGETAGVEKDSIFSAYRTGSNAT